MDIFTVTVLNNEDDSFETVAASTDKDKAINKGIKYLSDNRFEDKGNTYRDKTIKSFLDKGHFYQGNNYDIKLSIIELEK